MNVLIWILGHWTDIILWALIFDLMVTLPVYYLLWKRYFRPERSQV